MISYEQYIKKKSFSFVLPHLKKEKIDPEPKLQKCRKKEGPGDLIFFFCTMKYMKRRRKYSHNKNE